MAIQPNVIQRIYDDTICYERGPFEPVIEEGNNISTNGHAPTASNNLQNVPEYDEEVLTYTGHEAVLKKIYAGKDGRQIVDATTVFPNSIHAKIVINFEENPAGGTGSLVGPHHVLTCAHNISHPKAGFAKDLFVYPARNKKAAPFDRARVTQVFLFDTWEKTRNKAFDIALLVLDKSIGLSTGWGGMVSRSSDKDPLFDERFSITGYPSDKGGGYEMWTMEHTIDTVSPDVFRYDHDTSPGQSGSAIWTQKDGQVKIVGVHTLGPDSNRDKNSGVRITQHQISQLLIENIRNTFIIKPPVAPQAENKKRKIETMLEKPKTIDAAGERVFEMYIKIVESSESKDVKTAVEGLGKIAMMETALSQKALESLIHVSCNPLRDMSARRKAIEYLKQIGLVYKNPKAITPLSKLVIDTSLDNVARYDVAEALIDLTRNNVIAALPNEVTVTLAGIIGDRSPNNYYHIRYRSLQELEKIVKNGNLIFEDAPNDILELAKDIPTSDSQAGLIIATTLEEIVKSGSAASKKALIVLTSIINGSTFKRDLRSRAAAALGNITQAGAVWSQEAFAVLKAAVADDSIEMSIREEIIQYYMGKIVKADIGVSLEARTFLLEVIKDTSYSTSMHLLALEELVGVIKKEDDWSQIVIGALVEIIDCNTFNDTGPHRKAIELLGKILEKRITVPQKVPSAIFKIVKDSELQNYEIDPIIQALSIMTRLGDETSEKAMKALEAMAYGSLFNDTVRYLASKQLERIVLPV